MKDSSPLSSRKISDQRHFQAIHSESSDAFSDQSPAQAGGPPEQPLVEQSKSQTEMHFVNEEDLEALGAAAPPLPTTEEPKPLPVGVASPASKTDSPSRRKGAEAGASGRAVPTRGLRVRSFLQTFRTRWRWKLSRDICCVQSVSFA